MEENTYRNRNLRILFAVIIFSILSAAAVIKIVYPSPALGNFFFIISIFEMVLAVALALFWNRRSVWALASLVFAAWGGYSLYAAIFGLPCQCLGVAVTLPRGISLGINVSMMVLSWKVLRDFGLATLKVSRLVFLTVVLFVVGFVSAYYLYIKF